MTPELRAALEPLEPYTICASSEAELNRELHRLMHELLPLKRFARWGKLIQITEMDGTEHWIQPMIRLEQPDETEPFE